MSRARTTCWTIISDAAQGDDAAREEFAARYESVVRSYLKRRWRGNQLIEELDDAVQEVFVECLKAGGALVHADRERGSFRAFLSGVVRNVAHRFAKRVMSRRVVRLGTDAERQLAAGDETKLEFEIAWARERLREAGRRHEAWARERGEGERRRLELLKLRYHNSVSMRAISERWNIGLSRLYRELERAQKEYRKVLMEVVSFYHPGTPAEIEAECVYLRSIIDD